MNKSDLIARIDEAHRTWDLMPDPDRRFRLAKLASWPHFVREMGEGYGWHAVRAPRIPPTPQAIDRTEEVMGWFARYLNDHQEGAKALWLCYGRGLSLAKAAWVLRISKSGVAKRRDAACGLLLYRLSKVKPQWVDHIRLTGTK